MSEATSLAGLGGWDLSHSPMQAKASPRECWNLPPWWRLTGASGDRVRAPCRQGFSQGMLGATASVVGLEPEPGVGLEMCWGNLAKCLSFCYPCAVTGSKFVHASFKCRVSVSYSPRVLPVVNPAAFPNQLRGIIFRIWSPGLGCPTWGLNYSLLKENF